MSNIKIATKCINPDCQACKGTGEIKMVAETTQQVSYYDCYGDSISGTPNRTEYMTAANTKLPAEARNKFALLPTELQTEILAFANEQIKDLESESAHGFGFWAGALGGITVGSAEYANKLLVAQQNEKFLATIKEELSKENVALRAKCDHMEQALKDIIAMDGHKHGKYDVNKVASEALEQQEGGKKDGLEWLYGDHIEFCYRHPDGRVEVKYRRIEGTVECNDMISEVNNLIDKAKPAVSPYFYRKAGEKEVKP
jgi:hypothetical protein